MFITYRKPREYKMLEADTSASDAISEKLEFRHYVTMAAAVVVVVVQVVVVIGSIVPVERALKRNFDDQGRKRN